MPVLNSDWASSFFFGQSSLATLDVQNSSKKGRRGTKAFQQSPLRLSPSPRVPVPSSVLPGLIDQRSDRPAAWRRLSCSPRLLRRCRRARPAAARPLTFAWKREDDVLNLPCSTPAFNFEGLDPTGGEKRALEGRRGTKAFQQSPLRLSPSPRVPVPSSVLPGLIDQRSDRPAAWRRLSCSPRLLRRCRRARPAAARPLTFAWKREDDVLNLPCSTPAFNFEGLDPTGGEKRALEVSETSLASN
ncbi:hypothetical protein F2P81_004302 [Scophthalmus maximus]|uniref:Uncharacterized protein n=1 Tax=Scophthalmus maximus TaxID=52904 RepID=A0A6A4TCM7_SCOMX|nr:hypothetical protein F2P81_004302 [Scophthalmus maximus]